MQCYPFIHSDDLECPTGTENLRLVRAQDCDSQPVQWLWPEKIPLGKVTLLIGDPGVGKSLVAIDIAARASRAADWSTVSDFPQSNSPSPEPPAPASTILLSASDDLADTIRPRLDAAGADPRRVFVINSIADLRADFNQLRAAVSRAPDCRLIIIDPINAYVGPADSHFQIVVRKVLVPLAELAAEKCVAVVAIAHYRKSEGHVVHRTAGSIGYVAAARAVWSVSLDPNDVNKRLFLPIKNNLTPAAGGLAFTIHQSATLDAPVIRWDPVPIDRERSTLYLRPQEDVDLHPVRLWLREALAGGPRAAATVLEAASQYGFHERTVRRALHAIGGQTQNRGIFDGWWWSLPALHNTTEPGIPPKTVR